MTPGEYLAIVRGERRGLAASAMRGALRLASIGFRVGVAARGVGYQSGWLPTHAVPLPVISVGNLTTGGTGKTPLVIALARALIARGERPAVLARGYGAARDGELNDELRLVAREVPGALVLAGRDRAARAGDAARQGASVLVLDDGFQHRRLGRDVDVVVLDATDPWGPGGLLPRGLLREPRTALARADVVVLSRLELVPPSARESLEREVRAAGFGGPIVAMRTAPRALEDLRPPPGGAAPSEPPTALEGRAVLAACGIGNPAAFRATLAALGARVVDLVALPDHHHYRLEDVSRLEDVARRLDAERVVVTAKDAVKLEPLLRQPRADGGARLLPGPAGGAAAPVEGGGAASEGPGLRWSALTIEASLDPAGEVELIIDRARARAASRA